MDTRAYILAGGKSSRMGRDKAMLELGGMTLLARTVKTLRAVSGLKSVHGQALVTIAGKREALEGADRSIVDRYPGCGPLGGIEAALDDLGAGNEADWAFFLPVDMPLLQAEVIDRLLDVWIASIESDPSVRACCAEGDGRPQPLVSLVHRTVYGAVRAALDAGSYKVLPVLESAGLCCTSLSVADPLASRGTRGSGISLPDASTQGPTQSSESEKTFQTYDVRSGTAIQFTNVNTEADLIEVATLMKQRG